MATRSSILARKIPWTEEPGRSMGLQRVGHIRRDLARTHNAQDNKPLHKKELLAQDVSSAETERPCEIEKPCDRQIYQCNSTKELNMT